MRSRSGSCATVLSRLSCTVLSCLSLVAAVRDAAIPAFVAPDLSSLHRQLSSLSLPLVARWASKSRASASSPPTVWERALKQTVTDYYEWLQGCQTSSASNRARSLPKDQLAALPDEVRSRSADHSLHAHDISSSSSSSSSSSKPGPFRGVNVWSTQPLIFSMAATVKSGGGGAGGGGGGGDSAASGPGSSQDILDLIDPMHGAWRKTTSTRGTMLID